MQVKIYHSALNMEAENKLILDLSERDKTQNHIIVTPDKKSLYYEKKLFSLLNEDSFFDITTTTLSRFANKINNTNEKVLSKQGGVLIIKKILNDCAGELTSFGKDCNMLGFAEVLYDTICMFKSCNVPFDDIKECSNPQLSGKLNDIKLVYQKYEEYLKNTYTDSFNRLSLCVQKINASDFSKTNVYFVGFDDFTMQAYAVINKFIKCCNSVNISTAFAKKSETKHNANIYLNAIYYNIIDLAKQNGADLKLELVECKLTSEKQHIQNELFGYSLKKYENKNDYIQLLSYNSLDDEVKNTIQNIKFKIITNNLKYNNFAIVVSSLTVYKDAVKKYMQEYGVNYFLDEAIKLKDTMIARYISNCVTLLNKVNKYNLLAAMKSPFSGLNYSDVTEFENYISVYSTPDHLLLKCEINDSINGFLSKIKGFLAKSNECVTVIDFLNLIKANIINDEFNANYQKVLEQYYALGDVYNYRTLMQSYEKIGKIFNEFAVVETCNCSAQEMVQFINLYLDNVTITIPPVVTDAVFVTELNSGMLENVDYVFMLGMTEGAAPSYVVDCGLISDKEIDDMPKSFKLSPSVAVINKRLKFKTFESCFLCNKQLILSYPNHNGGQDNYPSSVVENLKNIFGLSVVDGSMLLDLIQNDSYGFNEANFIYNNFNKNTAIKNYVDLFKFWEGYGENKNFVKVLENLKTIAPREYLDNVDYVNNYDNVKLGKPFSKMGISEIEKFNMCPYLHFCDYLLKIKENDTSEINNMVVGNILHEFLKTAVFNLDKDNDYAIKLLNEILSKADYKRFYNNKNNTYIIRGLFDEVVRVFNVLKKQNEISGFNTFKTELPFLSEKPVYEDELNKVYLTGVIDRIDTTDNGFRVVDYKTGKIDFKNYNGIFYGNKMQVVVYMCLFSDKKYNLQPLGALYLPISNDFSDNSYEELYKMQGIIENSLNNMLNFDKNLNNLDYVSNVIDLKNEKGKIKENSFYKNMCLSNEQIKDLSRFVLDKIRDTISRIISGQITPNPINENEKCAYCKYIGMCNFNKLYGNSEHGGKSYANIESLSGGDENGRD